MLFQSQKDVEIAREALTFRQEELKSAIGTLLDFLVPEANRRSSQTRRSGSDRRASRARNENNGLRTSDRRRHSDRRLPPYEHLRSLRGELEQVVRLQDLVNEYKSL